MSAHLREDLGMGFHLSCFFYSAMLVATGCQFERESVEFSSETAELIGGSVTEDDLAVAALTSFGGSSSCTASLVSPSVLLTAAHCIDDLGNEPGLAAYFGSNTRGNGRRIALAASSQHPLWTGDSSQGTDIGLLLMAFPHPDPLLPARLNTADVGDFVGSPYRHVGFGVFNRQTGEADGQKRQGTTTILSVLESNQTIQSGDDQLSVCFGDSGGPGLIEIDGVEYVAGVHSTTTVLSPTEVCVPPNADTNVALYVDDYILPWIEENDPVCGEDGTCAPFGCNDDPDCTPCGPNGECTNGCALPDPDCPTSALGEICQAKTQCTTGLCVFWQQDLSYKFCSKECADSSECPEGMACQSVMPFGKICYYENDPPGVLGDECTDAVECGAYQCLEETCVVDCDLSRGVACPDKFECASHDDGASFQCWPEPSGGCSQSGRGNGPIAAVLLLLIFAIRRNADQAQKQNSSVQSAGQVASP